MAATFNWCEDNGAATGSPAHGTTRSGFGADTHYQTDVNWKTADDCTANSGTPYSSAPITSGSGNYSYPKYSYGKFTGSYNQISSGKWTAHDDSTTFASNIVLIGKVTSTYTTPSTATAIGGTNFTSQVPVASGLTVLFSPNGPEDSSPVSTYGSGTAYTQYLVSQLQLSGNVSPGDTAQVTAKLQYNEN
jgi:hypothetical protein